MRFFALALTLALLSSSAIAQQAAQAPSLNQSISIGTGNQYQAISTAGQNMRSLTIQNNNTSADNCFIEVTGLVAVGATTGTAVTPPGKAASTAGKVSILLTPGQSYSRYFPLLPNGPIVATCATAGNSLYVDWQ